MADIVQEEVRKGVPHLSVLLCERTSTDVNLLIEETRRDNQSAKPHNIDFIAEYIFKGNMLRANNYTEFVSICTED